MAVFGFSSISRRVAATAAVLTLSLGAAACGGDDGPDTTRYNFVSISVNGVTDNTPPFLVAEGTDETLGDYKLEIASGYLDLVGSNRYRVVADINAMLGGTPFPFDDTPEEGSYSVSGTTYTFNPDDDDLEPFTATLTGGNTLTFSETFETPEDPLTVTVTARH